MSINDFYYSRRLSELIDSNKQKMWDEIKQGQLDSETIYVFSTAEEAQLASKSMNIFYNGDLLLGTTGDTADTLALKSIEPCNLTGEKTQEGSLIYDAEPGIYYVELEGDNAASAWIAVGNEESNSPNALMDDGSLASMMVQVKDGEKIRLTYGSDKDLNVRIWKVR